MLTLWALVTTLTVHAAAVDPLSLPSGLPNLSGRRPILQSGQFPRYPPIPKGSPSIKYLSETPKPSCVPVAKFFMSSSQFNDYLNSTLPPQIEELLKCAEVDLAGLLGTLLETVSSLDLLSLLDLTSPLNILGGGGQGGPPDMGTSSESSNLPLPSLSKATDAVGNLIPLAQGVLGGLLPNGAKRDPARKAGSSLLSNLPLSGVLNQVSEPLSGVLNTVGGLTESTEGILNSVVPGGVTDALSGLLGGVNLKDLLLGLEVQKTTVDDMMSVMTDDGILVQAQTTAFIGGKGLVGPVISLLGFQVNGDMTLKIGISINSTQCVNLQVQDIDIKVNKVYLQLVKTVTDTLPLPVPLPLVDIISQLLTVNLKENLKEAKSCNIDLSDFTECKNPTQLFQYYIRSLQASEQGLSILYCAFFNGKVLTPSSLLPPDPKNANIAITLSNIMLREIITVSAKQSSVEMNDLNAHITRIVYFSLPGNKIQVTYWVNVNKDGEIFAQGLTRFFISYAWKIVRGTLMADLRILSFVHSTNPPEAMDEVEDVMSAVMKKFVSAITEFSNQWNIPPGITSNLPTNAKVELLNSRDLQAAI
ncbi:vomeromodulin-like isoform X2 [Phyllostomus discolor]|uniref:Vomeromodulin-like isoform X1 n=1 Tax=Phyllostomus discolor TaxID=89673 RepID=A0A7E6CF60_9CHIR|nr:vomeromodulin-like isoform X1 [Phyllostomus discolor]XP_035865616.1 vomeromodulin-like isoform X2 [Phyllostomus discolor]